MSGSALQAQTRSRSIAAAAIDMQRSLTAESLREQVLDASAKMRDAFIRRDAQVCRAPSPPRHQRTSPVPARCTRSALLVIEVLFVSVLAEAEAEA